VLNRHSPKDFETNVAAALGIVLGIVRAIVMLSNPFAQETDWL
jgi:hypothetical protein